MKSFSISGLMALLAVLAMSSCGKGARLDVDFGGTVPAGQVTVRLLDLNTYKPLDTLKLNKAGKASCQLPVSKGNPEFFYVFYGDTRIASLLLEKGDRVKLEADTLAGKSRVYGSPQCDTLRQIEQEYSSFIYKFAAESDPSRLAALYVAHYREALRHVVCNPFSLVVMPLLYERISDYTPLFNNPEDAVIFRSAADSLKKVYPESRYVKALDKEAARREQSLGLSRRIEGAGEVNYPDLELPDINGQIRRLSEIEAPAILVHFWSANSPAHKIFNLDTLLPLYERFHPKGLEIYSVCADGDKILWASVMNAQKLPWINVNDGKGAASKALALYNVTELPCTFLLANGRIYKDEIKGETALRRELSALLD